MSHSEISDNSKKSLRNSKRFAEISKRIQIRKKAKTGPDIKISKRDGTMVIKMSGLSFKNPDIWDVHDESVELMDIKRDSP